MLAPSIRVEEAKRSHKCPSFKTIDIVALLGGFYLIGYHVWGVCLFVQ